MGQVTTGLAGQPRATLRGDARRIAPSRPGTIPPACAPTATCSSTDALSANQNLPSPDRTLTRILSAAYAAASAAGRHCLDGAAGNRRLLARSAAELATRHRGT